LDGFKKSERKTGGELSQIAASDTTNYEVLEVGHAMVDDIFKECRKSIEIYKPMINENEFCVVMQIASDPIIKNLKRRKFYCWPFLPSPRPNQSVWLYNKSKDEIVKRLWILPTAQRMASLSEMQVVPNEYLTMQAWSIAFFKGTFWDFIRHMHDITMLSESEYLKANREKLIKAGCKVPESRTAEPFDFSKIHIKNVVDTVTPVSDK
jgi:hypothetical protein